MCVLGVWVNPLSGQYTQRIFHQNWRRVGFCYKVWVSGPTCTQAEQEVCVWCVGVYL